MVSAMGENGTREFLREAILSITIGSNDVLNYFQPSVPFLGEENKVSATVFQDFMVSNFTLQFKVPTLWTNLWILFLLEYFILNVFFNNRKFYEFVVQT